MEGNPLHRAIYLVGPTAVGKTAVGLNLARRMDAEIVALDSMTLYRGMDIGTAKPTPADRGAVPPSGVPPHPPAGRVAPPAEDPPVPAASGSA